MLHPLKVRLLSDEEDHIYENMRRDRDFEGFQVIDSSDGRSNADTDATMSEAGDVSPIEELGLTLWRLCLFDDSRKLKGWQNNEHLEAAWHTFSNVFASFGLSDVRVQTCKLMFVQGIVLSISLFWALLFWFLIVVVLGLFYYVLSIVWLGWLLRSAYQAFSIWYVLEIWATVIPYVTLWAFRTFGNDATDKIFLASLARNAPALSERLEAITPPGVIWKFIIKLIVQGIAGLFLAMIFFAVSCIPFFGRWITAAVFFLKLRHRAGTVIAVILSLASLLPGGIGRAFSLYGVQFIQQLHYTSRAVLNPAFCRMNRKAIHHLYDRHQARLSGLAITCSVILAIPILGPLAWFPLVAAAATVLGDAYAEETSGGQRSQIAIFRQPSDI